MAIIISSGEIESGIILENDAMTILDGGTATTTTINNGGRLYVSTGGKANSTTINEGGMLLVSTGGEADSTTVNEGGMLQVSSAAATTSSRSAAVGAMMRSNNLPTARSLCGLYRKPKAGWYGMRFPDPARTERTVSRSRASPRSRSNSAGPVMMRPCLPRCPRRVHSKMSLRGRYSRNRRAFLRN